MVESLGSGQKLLLSSTDPCDSAQRGEMVFVHLAMARLARSRGRRLEHKCISIIIQHGRVPERLWILVNRQP